MDKIVTRMKAPTQIIRNYMEKKGISQAALSKMIKESPQNINQKLLKDDMPCGMMYKISMALEHDFFYEMSEQLPKEIRTKNTSIQSSDLERALVEFMRDKFPNLK